MSGVTYDYMEEYLRSLIPESGGVLKDLEEYAISNNVPIIQKEAGKFLEVMISIMKPKKILELGTAIGYSSIMMSMTAGQESRVVTIERDKSMIELANGNISRFGFQDRIKVVEGDCLEVLEAMEDEFDLVFMDAGKGHYKYFLPHCLRMLKKDGVIIADNVLFRGMIASKELVKRRKITIVKRMRDYLNMVNSDEGLITTVLPMGDGIAVTKRRNS